MKAKDLITFLQTNPEAEVVFVEVDGMDDRQCSMKGDLPEYYKAGERCDHDHDNICTDKNKVSTKDFFIFL